MMVSSLIGDYNTSKHTTSASFRTRSTSALLKLEMLDVC